MPKYKLSCCIVVKNEEKVILYCLDNIKTLADEIVIVDTGSTDKTIQLVEKFVKFSKVGNKFHDTDGDFHFGDAKTYAFSQATKDFVLWLDASDIVTDDIEAKKVFVNETNKNPKVYFTMPTSISKTVSFNRVRIAPRENVKMEGRVHEFMVFPDDGLRKCHIPININNQKNKPSSKRNLKLLHKEWKLNPSARISFYMACSYRELNDMKSAYEWFKKRIYNFEWKDQFREEHYKSLESVADLLLYFFKKDKSKNADLLDISDEMIRLEPDRYEGYYYKAKYHMNKQEWKIALELLNTYKKCKIPTDIKLWVDRRIYDKEVYLMDIEKCETSIKYGTPLVPDEIIDYVDPSMPPGSGRSTYKLGNGQY